MPKVSEAHRESRRDQILDAALARFAERGFQATSMTDIFEAAALDGTNGWQRFKDVTVPQLSNVINVVTALLLIGGFNVFDIVFVMTQGGPANATEVIATLTYKEAFTQNRVGYASTLSLVMTVIALVASVAFIRLREQREG